MPKYAVPGNQGTISSSYKTGAVLTAATAGLRRIKVYDILVGASANPNSTDTYIQFDVSRQTAAGTATSFTPNPLDPADPAAFTVAGVNSTVEGTVTANSSLWNEAVNQRNSVRWIAADESQMLIGPATNLNGLALRAQSGTYAGSVTAQLNFLE